MRTPLCLPFLLAPLLGGCPFDPAVSWEEGKVPRIACERLEDCPPEWVCRQSLGRCVPAELTGGEAPEVVGEPTLSPEVARAGALVTITFEVSEPLEEDPRVVAQAADAELLFVLDEEATDRQALRYAYSYEVKGDEPEETVAVYAELLDVVGEASRQRLGGVRFDFTPPSVLEDTGALELEAPPGSLVPSVSALAQGGTARVRFTVTEPLAGDPEVYATEPARLDLVQESVAGTAYSYALTLEEPGVAQGAYTVVVELVDVAGNAAALPLSFPEGALVVDTVAPPPPAAHVPGAVVHHRVPWGSEGTGGAVEIRVVGAPGAVSGAGTVIVHSAASGPRAELGRGPTGDDGSFELSLLPSDYPRVFLTFVDVAGNASTSVRVRDGAFTATLGGKVPGSAVENPHRFTSSRVSGAPLSGFGNRGGAVEEPGDLVGGLDGQLATVVSGARFGRFPERVPEGRYEHGLVYDLARDRALLFGGFVEIEALSDTEQAATPWEWNGHAWRALPVADPEVDGSPEPRVYGQLVYDARAGAPLLVGGLNGYAFFAGLICDGADLWRWRQGSWQHLAPDDPEGDGGPTACAQHAATYDLLRERLVLFGGFAPEVQGDELVEVAKDETWEWDGTSWRRIVPTDLVGDGNPSARAGTALTYHLSASAALLFGGETETGLSDETWLFDGAEWILAAPADPEGDGNPAPRRDHVLAYDWARDVVVLFGGSTGAGLSDETWEWNGTSWARIPPADPEGDGQPSARAGARLTYDVVRGRALLFGGEPASGDGTAETWAWDGTSWTLLSAPRLPIAPDEEVEEPPPRIRHALAFDGSLGRPVMYGGTFFLGLFDNFDLWNGHRWVPVEVQDPEGDGDPDRRAGTALAYDEARGRLVLFGGTAAAPGFFATELDDETWEWDGTSWRMVTPTDPEGDGNPAPRTDHAMAYDAARARVVLFGGSTATDVSDETWEWDGTSWARVTPSDPEGDGNPPAREEPLLVWDGAGGRVVLFGGTSDEEEPFGDLWAFDGESWERLVPEDPEGDGDPSPRTDAALAYFPARGTLVLFGGAGSLQTPENDVWEWDGTSWARLETGDVEQDGDPAPTFGQAMVHDPNSGCGIVFGGFASDTLSNETWTLCLDEAARPAQLVRVDLDAMGVLDEVELTALHVRAFAGGDGALGASQAPGARLETWTPLGFALRDENEAALESPEALEWQSADPTEVEGSLLDRALHLRITSRGTNGAGLARVSTDYVEVRVQYQLP